MKEPIKTELTKVPETPPRNWDNPYYPFKTADEYIDALKQENETLIAEIENKQLRGGSIPIGMLWWKLLAGGLGSALIGWLLKGVLS
jgi:hypothetical protein